MHPVKKIAMAVGLIACAAGAQAAPDQAEANKAVVAAFYQDVFVEHKFDEARKYLAENYRQHSGDYRGKPVSDRHQGREAFVAAFKEGWEKATPEQREAAHTKVLELIASGNRVVVYSQFSGRKKDGTAVTATEFDMFEVENGRILGHWSPEPLTPIDADAPEF